MEMYERSDEYSILSKKLLDFETSKNKEMKDIKFIIMRLNWLKNHKNWLIKKERISIIDKYLPIIDFYLYDDKLKEIKISSLSSVSSDLSELDLNLNLSLMELSEKLLFERDKLMQEVKILDLEDDLAIGEPHSPNIGND